MIIDTHIHENTFSADSFMDLADIVTKAREVGLDGICITDHDSNDVKDKAASYSMASGFPIFVGAEVLTYEGDILVFGLDRLPKEMVHAQELVDLVNRAGGAAISAHPFRDNNRGLGNHIRSVKGLHGIEAFNGSTKAHHNRMAYDLSRELGLASLGASDAHVVKAVGKNATVFHGRVRDMQDLIDAIRHGKTSPAILGDGGYAVVELDGCMEEGRIAV